MTSVRVDVGAAAFPFPVPARHKEFPIMIARGRCLALALFAAPLFASPCGAQAPAIVGAPTVPGNAQAPAGKLVQEAWDIAFIDGKRAGYVHLVVEELPHKSGEKIIRASRELR